MIGSGVARAGGLFRAGWITCALLAAHAFGDSLIFSYQGYLEDQGQPADGIYDMYVEFYDAATNGNQVATPLCYNNTVVVSNGLFNVDMTIADSQTVLNGAPRWVQLYVRPANAGSDCNAASFQKLAPRQPLSPTPYAGLSLNTRGIFVQDSPAFVGIGRETRITGAERFGVHVPTSNYGGMYVSTNSGGEPFYGYAQDGVPTAFHYVDGASGDWRLSVGANDRFSIGSDGIASFFGESGEPTLEVGPVDDYIGFWRRDGGLSRIMMSFHPTAAEPFTKFTRNVAFGLDHADAPVHAKETGAAVAIFDRSGSDGTVITIANDGVAAGTISVSGTTVSYNAFTGSHYAYTDDQPERGMLLTLTGANRRLNGADGECIHGVRLCTQANDPAVLGAYNGLLDSAQQASDANPVLAMAEGNGDLWLVDNGTGNVLPGDALISADTAGCAMRDDAQRFPVGYIVARAAELVDWTTVPADATGAKRAKVAVLFDRFVRQGDVQATEALAAQLALQQKQLAAQQAEIETLRKLIADLAASKPGR